MLLSETALRAHKFLIVANSTREELASTKRILGATNGAAADAAGAAPLAQRL